MIKDITLGQFFPGDSILHKTDPRMKIILSILFIVVVFLANTLSGYVLLVVLTGLLVLLSKIPLKIIMKGMKPILFIIIFTSIINIFFNQTGEVLLSIWKITIHTGGLITAGFMIIRIATLLMGTSVLLTYTTSPITLTDAIERLLKPLKYIKVPVHEFAMMMTIALRFIPTLIEETDKIMSAQKARGADINNGGLVKRVKALIPILVPLFISAFRRADELATAMESRCYHGGNGRTQMTVLHLKARDFIVLSLIIIFGVGIVLINNFYPILTI